MTHELSDISQQKLLQFSEPDNFVLLVLHKRPTTAHWQLLPIGPNLLPCGMLGSIPLLSGQQI